MKQAGTFDQKVFRGVL